MWLRRQEPNPTPLLNAGTTGRNRQIKLAPITKLSQRQSISFIIPKCRNTELAVAVLPITDRSTYLVDNQPKVYGHTWYFTIAVIGYPVMQYRAEKRILSNVPQGCRSRMIAELCNLACSLKWKPREPLERSTRS